MTLAAHANAALRSGTALRLPAHPAFTAVRRARFRDGDTAGDVAAWFDAVRAGGGPLLLSSAGVDSEAVVTTGAERWRVRADGGAVVVESAAAADHTRLAASIVVCPLNAAGAALRSAAERALQIAAGTAPALWAGAVERAVAILRSPGTGEELSDVAWPHFLLPTQSDLCARRLAAAAATLWLWEGPGAWAGPAADDAHAPLLPAVEVSLAAAVAG